MRISSQNVDVSVQQTVKPKVALNTSPVSEFSNVAVNEPLKKVSKLDNAEARHVETKEISAERLNQAVDSINEFLEVSNKTSKFVLHDGLDKYYVRLVDAQTEEVIKEIPPERLLDAFYEMQKLAGMIVDEKI